MLIFIMLKNKTQIDKVNTLFSTLHTKMVLDAGFGLFDEHKHSEDFFKGLLNILYQSKGYYFENINIVEKNSNFPAIDLYERSGEMAVQITSRTDRDKVNDTIKLFIKKELYKKYKRLVVIIITPKIDFKSEFDTKGKFIFDKKRDVQCLSDLSLEISQLSTEKIEDILEYIKKQMELFQIKSEPIRLSEMDIKELVLQINNVIKDEIIQIKTDLGKEIELTALPDSYIAKKNLLNNVEEEYFNGSIRKSIVYHDKIQQFLKNPINKKTVECYLAVVDELQELYLSNGEKFDSITKFFIFVYNRVADKFSQELGYDKRKIRIVLHCMYFGCEIGIKPTLYKLL